MNQQAPSQAPWSVRLTAVGSALIVGLVASPAFARDRDGSYGYDNASRSDYAEVLSARPIYTQVRVSQPRRECREEQVTYREPRYTGDNAAGAILGGIIGGVAGHQFGGGSGRAVATGIGAVVGAGVGSRAGQYDRGGDTRTSYETRCETFDDTHVEDRVDGYDVTYRYQGATYHTTMPYDPGNRIAVNVDVRPVRY